MSTPYSVPSDDSTPFPVDFARLVTDVRDMGYELDILLEGRAAGAVFDKVPFLLTFDASGRFISIRAMWDTELSADAAAHSIFAAADSWNREKYFPTVYWIPSDSGSVQVCADFVIDAGAGVSRRQLRKNISAGISTGISAIAYMKEAAAHTLGWVDPRA